MEGSANQRARRVNVITNAIATMLVYTSFFAGTMILPKVLKKLSVGEGDNQINDQTAYYCMAVHSLSAAISCPVAVFIMKNFGIKVSLTVGSACCTFFYLSMMLPTPSGIALYITQSVFGFGLALVRPASLKFLIRNTTPSGMGRDSGIHWGLFMSSMIWGNIIVFVLFKDNITDHKRIAVYGILGALNILGVVMFILLRQASPRYDEESTPLVNEMKEDLSPTRVSALIKETFSLVVLKQTLWLLPSMVAAGFYFTVYCVHIPATIKTSYIGLFGILVGSGELLGSLVLGQLITEFGYVLVVLLSSVFAIISLLVTYTAIYGDSTSLPLIVAVGFVFGVSDAGNNTALSTIIGRLFSEKSEVIFSVMSCVMNLSAMTWYFIYTVVPFQTIIAVTGVTVFVSMVGIFIVVRPK